MMDDVKLPPRNADGTRIKKWYSRDGFIKEMA